MTTSELISYIEKQIKNNTPKDLIISKLVGAGWHREDIDEGFSKVVEFQLKTAIPFIEKKEVEKDKVFDKYQEPIIENNSVDSSKIEKSTLEDINLKQAQIDNSKLEVSPLENPQKDLVIEEIPKETPKVWTPMSVPIKEKVEIKSIELPKVEIPNIESSKKELEPKLEKFPSVESINSEPLKINQKYFNEKGEVIPVLSPKDTLNSFGYVKNDNLVKPDNSVNLNEIPQNTEGSSLSKIAMLSSYKKDILSSGDKKEVVVKKKSRWGLKLILIILVIVIGLSITWTFVGGYVNIKDIENFFIKKDPKVILLNNSEILSSLKSYKTETNIEISSLAFPSIHDELMDGEVASSQNKDFISISSLGKINKNEDNSIVSDGVVTIKSSLLEKDIFTNIKNNGSDSFILFSDLNQIMDDDLLEPKIVKINKEQVDLFLPLFSLEMEENFKKINIYKIFTDQILAHINNDTINIYNDFINNATIIEKDLENIKGIDTYHYSINTDIQSVKKLLNKISKNFIMEIYENQENDLNEIINSITIDSFDVWVGKKDNNIYQYSVNLKLPLSKVVESTNKSILDDSVDISWKTIYYDFNVINEILTPVESINIVDFTNNIEQISLKKEVSSFKQFADNLFAVEKSYGKKSNTTGSCINPVSGSLFSPIDHLKNSTEEINSISLLLNKILEKTNNNGFCFSDSKGWSFSIPISDNYDPSALPEGGYKAFFCVDSTGLTADLTNPPTGIICK